MIEDNEAIMPTKKQIQPGQKVPLKLTAAERKLVLEQLMCLDQDYEQIIRGIPSGKPVMMTLNDLDDFGGYIAAEANHCNDNKQQKRLDAVFEKIQRLLDTYTDEESPQNLKIEDARKERAISDQAAQVAGFAAQALEAAEQLRIKTKPFDNFGLAPAQREVLLLIPGLSKTIKKKLANEKPLSLVEVASMTMAVAESLPDAEGQKRVALLMVTKHLVDHLQEVIMAKAAPPTKKKPNRRAQENTNVLYQFKITLLDSNPPIWRRIQIQDCSLDKLHEHIQTAMGWTNSHLHQFEIKGERYGDPELLDDGFEDFECEDSTTLLLSEILPKPHKQFAFKYEYDFGDGWNHEVRYEGSPPPEQGKKYPLCLEGKRSCPPEDVGGIWGYADYLEALADPKHERHEDFMEWSGAFDPDDFDPRQATREMKKGLPDWQRM